MSRTANEFSFTDTRRIGAEPWNKLLAESEGRGWKNIHASLATVNTWKGAHHAHHHHCIAYCVSQPAYLRRRIEGGREEEMTLLPRQFFLIPAHRRSDWHRRGPTKMLMIYIRQELLDATAAELSGRTTPHGVEVELPLGTTDPFLEQFALSVLDVLGAEDDGSSAAYVDVLAQAAATHLLRRHSSGLPRRGPAEAVPRPCRSEIGGIGAFIDRELDGDLRIERLAAVARLPVSVFARSFRRTHGVSPRQYILARRVERARSLLVSTDLPIAQIALQTGFASQSHLTSAFGRSIGVTPARYRCVT